MSSPEMIAECVMHSLFSFSFGKDYNWNISGLIGAKLVLKAAVTFPCERSMKVASHIYPNNYMGGVNYCRCKIMGDIPSLK